MQLKDKLLQVLDKLIAEGTELTAGETYSNGVRWINEESLGKWHAGCQNLIHMMGPKADHWRAALGLDDSRTRHAHKARILLGTMQGIRDAVADDLVVRIEDLVLADAFANLLEQAGHLLDAGYFLPAGVLGRAVLEEHLRKWCQHSGCCPSKAKPTMSDFYQALYTAQHINLLQLKHIEAMTAVGNAAAHAKDSLTKGDVERMLRELTAFLASTSSA